MNLIIVKTKETPFEIGAFFDDQVFEMDVLKDKFVCRERSGIVFSKDFSHEVAEIVDLLYLFSCY